MKYTIIDDYSKLSEIESNNIKFERIPTFFGTNFPNGFHLHHGTPINANIKVKSFDCNTLGLISHGRIPLNIFVKKFIQIKHLNIYIIPIIIPFWNSYQAVLIYLNLYSNRFEVLGELYQQHNQSCTYTVDIIEDTITQKLIFKNKIIKHSQSIYHLIKKYDPSLLIYFDRRTSGNYQDVSFI
jgi:hypothetical protein